MKFKKLTGLLTALACGLLISSIGVSAYDSVEAEQNEDALAAAAYDDCDVDRNGVVDVSDAIVITRYLAGKYYVPGSEQKYLDTNKNQIIDSADADYVKSKIVDVPYSATFVSRKQKNENIKFPDITGFTADGLSSHQETRQYIKYVYGTMTDNKTFNECITEYPLTPGTTPITAQNQAVPYGQIGPKDDRVLATGLPENSGIVILAEGGTGFIVGAHKIATAAHCVYSGADSANGEHFNNLTIQTCKSDGTLTGETLTPVEVHIPKVYRQNRDVNYDYALITVKEDLSEMIQDPSNPRKSYPKYTQFSLSTSYNVTGSLFDQVPIYVTGKKKGYSLLYTDEGKVYTNVSNSTILKYLVDTDGTQSGSPVYTITKQEINGEKSYVYTALAIHTGGSRPEGAQTYTYNYGTRMTKYQTQFYLDDTNVGY